MVAARQQFNPERGFLLHKPGKAIKAVNRGNGLIEGYLVAWGHNQDTDLEGQWFTKSTDLRLDWFKGDLPVLYHHGMDQLVGLDPIGRIKSIDVNDVGLWVQAQLNTADRYGREVDDMVRVKRFGWSSGSVDHLVKIAPDGEIIQWPIFEGSVTPTPAQPWKTSISAMKAILSERDPVSVYLRGLEARAGNDPDANLLFEAEGEGRMALKTTKRFVANTLKRYGYKADPEDVEAIASELDGEDAMLEDDELDGMMADDEFDPMMADDEIDPMLEDDELDGMMADDEFDPAMMSDDEEVFPVASRRSRRPRKSGRRRSAQKAIDPYYGMDGGETGYGIPAHLMTPGLRRHLEAQRVKTLERRIKALELGEGAGERTRGIKGLQIVKDEADRPGAYKSVFTKYIQFGEGPLNPTEKYILYSKQERWAGGDSQNYRNADGTPYVKALTTSNASSVGFGVPDDVVTDLNRNLMVEATMSNDCNSRQTSSDTIRIPDLTTSDARRAFPGQAKWPGEKPSAQSESQITDISLGELELPIHVLLISTTATYTSLEDVAFDLQATLTEQFSEIVAVEMETLVWSGSGQGKLRGIVNDTRVTGAESSGISSVGGFLKSGDKAGFVTGDPFHNMLMHLPPQYRRNAKWYANSNTWAKIWNMKDGEGQFLWPEKRGMQYGIPSTFLDRPIGYNEFADDVAQNAFPLILADLKKAYLIGKRVEFSIKRFDDAAYAQLDQALFLGRARIGGMVVKPYAIKAMKIAA